MFAKGVLYKENEAILYRMGELGFHPIAIHLMVFFEEHFREIKELGIQPSVMCYCMMLAVYAKTDRRDKANELLNEMLTNRVSNIHQVIGQMITGDFDDASN
ncbi:Hypothetical predicted protein [Olea europaea subsp. europaea]|uniref:Pentatricopeptide repeat-containing protein n=1 Tax=Olea europaea subsp. europaea TaxID=158383 RepID=A0A8S0PZ45_OLEEU|nr:Hypothetical predicted protein [Olea europaea subsp. europaea]